MNKLKLMAAVALCMTYIAGIATGWAGYTLASSPPPPQEGRGSWLSHTLELNDKQTSEMKEIWSREGQGREGDDGREKMRALYDERNGQVRALLNEEQAKAFDEIYRAFDEKKELLSNGRRQRHEDAVRKTMAILTADQQERYQTILDDVDRRGSKKMRGRGN